MNDTAFELLPLHAVVEISPTPPETKVVPPSGGLNNKNQHRSRLCDVCGCDGRDQSATAGERGHAKRIVPAHHGVTAEVVAADGQQELAASCGSAAGRERSDGRYRRAGSAGHGCCQRDREHDQNGQSCSRGHWVCTSGTLR